MKLCYFAAADGIETYQLHEDDTLTLFDRYSAARPMYFSYDSGRLFALLRDPAGNGESAVLPLWVDDAGLPTDPSPSVPTGGREGCHLCVLDNVVYAANYSSGSIARIPLDGSPSTLLTHEGHGIRPDRQEMAHTHFIAPMPGDRYLAVCDLGLDRVFVYDRDLNPISEARFPDGCGPRHLCYSPDGQYAYCANELSSTVSILSCNGENGTFTHLSHLTTRAASHTDNDNYPPPSAVTEAMSMCPTAEMTMSRCSAWKMAVHLSHRLPTCRQAVIGRATSGLMATFSSAPMNAPTTSRYSV